MLNNNLLLVHFAAFLMLTACTGKPTAAGQEEGTNPPAAAATEGQSQSPYPSLPVARMQELFDKADYIDFVFYYADFSMNQSDEASIKATLAHVSTEVPNVDPACQPIGSLFFQSQGQELIQAELYYTGQCVYFIWLENGRRTYANKMTPAGFQFYQKIFQPN